MFENDRERLLSLVYEIHQWMSKSLSVDKRLELLQIMNSYLNEMNLENHLLKTANLQLSLRNALSIGNKKETAKA